MRSKKIDGCVIYTKKQKQCYDWLSAQKPIQRIIQIEKNGDWARVVIKDIEKTIPNPIGWEKKDFYE